jgi:hypothetical protein
MTDGPKPHFTSRAEAELAARREREAAALRANLRRRKDQQRSVAEPKPAPDEPQPD